jgi:N-acetylglucosamine kinase-like BadF-type ATPase
MSGVVVGVDGGGTSTDVAVADLSGSVLALERVGPSNHETLGVEAVVGVLAAALDAALTTAGAAGTDVRAAVFGLAGVDWPSDEARLDAALAELALGGERRVVNDSLVALRAGSREPWGVVSSAGTGSVTAGIGRNGEFARTMAVGWGEPVGSGTLVIDALHAVAAEFHGVGPATALTDRLVTAFDQRDVAGLFEAISRGRAGSLRRAAPIVTELAAVGDPVAVTIVDDVARQHADLAVSIARRVQLAEGPFDLVTAGGVHASGPCFADAFAARVHAACPTAAIVPLAVEPVVGAIRLAVETVTSGV